MAPRGTTNYWSLLRLEGKEGRRDMEISKRWVD
jgi:hypothetical protein